MRVLLTGSSGWLGRHLAPRLEAAGHDVVGLDIAPGPATSVLGSVADRALIDATFAARDVEAVIHAGALHKPDIARYPASAFVDVNVTGTLNLLEAAVEAGCSRFVFTSTTSLLITNEIRAARGPEAVWLDDAPRPLAPRNIYGVTKLSAEGLCRLYSERRGLPVVVLRTARFFPEDDDTLRELSGPNLKALEFAYRRLTVRDAADAHVVALDRAPDVGFAICLVSAPTPFQRGDAQALFADAAAVIARYYPDAPELFAAAGWRLPETIGRVYDASGLEAALGFRCATDFGAVLDCMRAGAPLPFVHDGAYVPPKERSADARAALSRRRP